MPLAYRLALALGALAALGCSDEPVTTEAGAGAASQSAAGSGGSVAGASGQGGGGSGGLGGSGGGGGGTAPAKPCPSYVDDPTWSLVVTIKNEMSQTLYLGQETSACEAQRWFEVEDGARTLLPSLQACRSSCQTAMTTGPVTCPTGCATPATVTLEPGQSLQVPWDGRFGVEEVLPQACMMTGAAATSCVRAERIKANVYNFIARAGTRRQCLDPSGACSCTPNPTGGCTAAASLIGGTIIETELFLKLEPGETSTSGDSPYIGLVFRDQP